MRNQADTSHREQQELDICAAGEDDTLTDEQSDRHRHRHTKHWTYRHIDRHGHTDRQMGSQPEAHLGKYLAEVQLLQMLAIHVVHTPAGVTILLPGHQCLLGQLCHLVCLLPACIACCCQLVVLNPTAIAY